jgi:hypothetical protein
MPERATSRVTRALRFTAALAVMLAGWGGDASAQLSRPAALLDVPFMSQTQALCGGAAAAMVLRFWGARDLSAESFAHLVDDSAAGIRTDALVGELRARGWTAAGVRGDPVIAARELDRGRPVMALIEDRPGIYHYVVVVGMPAGTMVFHDPASRPFRVMSEEAFIRQWRAAGFWMAVVLPGEGAPAGDPAAAGAGADEHVAPVGGGAPSGATSICEARVAAAVRAARADDLDTAERTLAAALACDGSAALRELAGVRLLQRRWPEVSDLAGAAVARDASDAQAWRLLATSRYVQGDAEGALRAWNRVSEPRLDLVRVDGLYQTRQRVAERLIGVPTGSVLAPDALRLARRRLSELPAARSTRLDYVPVPGGLAELRAGVAERPRMPSGRWEFVAIGVTAVARRELRVSSGALTGGGERITGAWRFWSDRPGWSIDVAAPAGTRIVRAEVSGERQPFDAGGMAPGQRTTGRAGIGGWVAPGWRVGVDAGMERRPRGGTLAVVGGTLAFASRGDRLRAAVDVERWAGFAPFARAYGSVRARTSMRLEGLVVHAGAGGGVLSRRAPSDRLFAADTGHVGPVLLRAHPGLDGAQLRTAQLSRAVVHGTIEARRWWAGPVGTRLAVAAFLDGVRTGRRLVPDGLSAGLDAGIGARLGLPGLPGVVRIDAGLGLRDRASALSFVYEP